MAAARRRRNVSSAARKFRQKANYWTVGSLGGGLLAVALYQAHDVLEDGAAAPATPSRRLNEIQLQDAAAAPATPSRRLNEIQLQVINGQECEPAKDDMYPTDLILTQECCDDENNLTYGKDPNNRWKILPHIIVIMYMLLGLNTVCDVFFTGALEVMVDVWPIKPDVAGATFMAAGGSAPELFTSLIGATIAVNDVGFGTIVGSAVFNVLFVIGLCGYAAKEEIVLTWWPLFRDCTYYILGLGVLAICCFDDQISLFEAILLFSGYVGYCTLMYYNEWLYDKVQGAARKAKTQVSPETHYQVSEVGDNRYGKFVEDDLTEVTRAQAAPESTPEATPEVTNNNPMPVTKRDPMPEVTDTAPPRILGNPTPPEGLDAEKRKPKSGFEKGGREGAAKVDQAGIAPELRQDIESQQLEEMKSIDEPIHAPSDSEDSHFMDKPDELGWQIVWLLSMPVYLALHFSIPPPGEKWFLVTFGLSLCWIAFFSFILVWLVEMIGQVCHIPVVLMGFTFLAAGTSIPDAVSSVKVAQLGEGDMAVSSSIGSNIFDILVGLPIPWIIKTGIIDAGKKQVQIKSQFLVVYVLLLLLMVLLTIISIHFIGWKLNKCLGACMAGLYALFLVIAVSIEINEPEWLMKDPNLATTTVMPCHMLS